MKTKFFLIKENEKLCTYVHSFYYQVQGFFLNLSVIFGGLYDEKELDTTGILTNFYLIKSFNFLKRIFLIKKT